MKNTDTSQPLLGDIYLKSAPHYPFVPSWFVLSSSLPHQSTGQLCFPVAWAKHLRVTLKAFFLHV